jgi:hypothetical protein
MATAMPPRAAEVANKRLVRQKFLGSGGCCGFSTSTGPALKGTNLRKGTGYRNLILRTASMALKSPITAKKIQESGFKKLRNMFFKEIWHLQLGVPGLHLLI